MAEANSEPKICFFYKEGDCKYGDSCRYKHERGIDPEALQRQEKYRPSEICRFFQQGSCSFGDLCNYSHASSIDPKWIDVPEFVPQGATSPQASSSYYGLELVENELRDFSLDESGDGQACGGDAFYSDDVTDEESSTDTFGLRALTKMLVPDTKDELRVAFTASSPLCPYAEASIICKKTNCPYLHGDLCDMCNRPVLHPLNDEQRKEHHRDCLKEYEENMNHSFAVAKSMEEVCGICYEKVLEKPRGKQRFGILPKCLHCFCLECIRNWRQKDGYEKETSRSCPVCRIVSDYVIPSEYWLDTDEEKVKLIQDYKSSMKTIHCKFFKRGKGSCPFNNSCFYLHALPDGTRAEEVRRIQNADGVEVLVEKKSLWDFVAQRNQL